MTPANCAGEVTVARDDVVAVVFSVEDLLLELVVVVVEVEVVLVVELTFLLDVDRGVIVALVETEVLEIPIVSEIPIPRMITTIATAMSLLFLLPPTVLSEESKPDSAGSCGCEIYFTF